MHISDFDYPLPPELVAQTPVEPRDSSRLMILDRSAHQVNHRQFTDILDYVHSGDTLVFNDSRVIPARIFGTTTIDSSKIEILLLRRIEPNLWETLVKPGKKARRGTLIRLADKAGGQEISAEVMESGISGTRKIRFSNEQILEKIGHVPLPPYIHTTLTEPERYQTIYARVKGSAAAPTAGLHFTRGLFDRLAEKNINFAFVTLHIGLDTFRPIRVDDPARHPIHTEYGEITTETSSLINRTRQQGKRVIVVGTSAARLVESASSGGTTLPFSGYVNLFILPGYGFKVTDAMITNFHLPRSSLLLLVSAFAGKDFILRAYTEAVNNHYRFYSFGDAMLIQ